MIKIRYSRPEKIQEAVARLREELGLTQQEMATRLGVAVQSVQRYERTTPPESDVLLKYIQAGDENLPSAVNTLRECLREDILAFMNTFEPAFPEMDGDTVKIKIPRRDVAIVRKGLDLLQGSVEFRRLLIEGLNAIMAMRERAAK